jgi:hypothetical protein
MAVAGSTIPAYLCPSDPGADAAKSVKVSGEINYSVCIGNTDNWCAAPSWNFNGLNCDNPGVAVIYGHSTVRIGDITDGTSNTMVVAENRIGFPYVQQDNNYAGCQAGSATPATSWCTSSGGPSPYAPCTGSPAGNNRYEPRGWSWVYAQGMQSWSFTTLLKPNDKSYVTQNMECTASPWQQAAFAARSAHTGGVHVLMTDGAVRFISDNISFAIWQYLGNRNDGNTIGEF